MLPVPTIPQLAAFTGRPEGSYTSYADACLMQAALQLTVVTELSPSDWDSLDDDYQSLAANGIMAMADYIFLRQPYQQVIASPLMNETVGSYSYGKSMQEVARNAAALEVTGERTGIMFFDLAVQYLAKRTLAGGVYSGGITLFEKGHDDGAKLRIDCADGRRVIIGPSEIDRQDVPWDVNAESFPQDPS